MKLSDSSWPVAEELSSATPAETGIGRTRRYGSSPSEIVVTPGMSLTASWTTLRSGGGIGSRSALGVAGLYLRRDLPGETGEGVLPAPPVPIDVEDEPALR